MAGNGFTFAVNSTAQDARAGGTIEGGVITTDVGNVGSGEDNLMTFTLAASALAVNGDRLEIEAAFTTAANGNNKTVKFYFGSQAYTTGALALNAAKLVVRATVIRTGAATQKVIVTVAGSDILVTTALLATFADLTETLSNATTIKFTGEATSDNDIVQEAMVIKFYPFV